MIESVAQRVWKKGHTIGIEEGIEKGIEKGLERGLEKGKLEEAQNIARNLIKLGMEDEFIEKATGLPIEEIQKLKI